MLFCLFSISYQHVVWYHSQIHLMVIFEVEFDNVMVPVDNLLLGEGRGFEIAQGHLGPSRIHHYMQMVGLCEQVLDAMCRHAMVRKTFGRELLRQVYKECSSVCCINCHQDVNWHSKQYIHGLLSLVWN